MRTRIGDFLLKIGAMTSDQVKHVLLRQQMGDTRRFGEIARAFGYIHDDSIKRYVEYLEKQEKGSL